MGGKKFSEEWIEAELQSAENASKRWAVTQNKAFGVGLWADRKLRARIEADLDDSRVRGGLDALWSRDASYLLAAANHYAAALAVIREQREVLRKAEEALAPFAKAVEMNNDDRGWEVGDDYLLSCGATVGDFRRAHKTLAAVRAALGVKRG